MACEEAWLLARFVREVAPDAALAMGPVPTEGENQGFPSGCAPDAARFTILSEKCPNRRGVEMVIEAAGGTTLTFGEFVERTGEGDFGAAWIVGGYPKGWVDKEIGKLAGKFELLVVQDIFENELTAAAGVVLPACAWVEREGCYVNAAGLVQTFERAIHPPDAARHDGQYLFEIAGYEGLYTGERVRELMAATMPVFNDVVEVPSVRAHAH